MSSRVATGYYLDTKGTLTTYFDELRNGRKIGETVDLHYSYCRLWITPLQTDNSYVPGGLCFPRWGNTAVPKLAKGGKFEARRGDVNNGSDNTKRLGLRIQTVTLHLANGGSLMWHDMPGVLSEAIHIQVGEECVKPAGLRAGQYLQGIDLILINKVTGIHPDSAAKQTEVA
jgi:hypothetical protein